MATLASAAGLVAALAGCAVLRIDVDVYKGPLANEEAVQMEQFTAMAIGAKPLLIALRDRLQWPDDANSGNKTRECARSRSWYKAAYLEKPPVVTLKDPKLAVSDPGNCKVTDIGSWTEPAGRVNAVLSLYDDQNLRGLEPYIETGDEALERYRDANAVFRDEAGNREAWERIAKVIADPSDDSLKKRFDLKDVAAPADLEKVRKGLQILQLGYKRLFGLELGTAEAGISGNLKSNRGADAVYQAYDVFLKEIAGVKDKSGTDITEKFKAGLIDEKNVDRGSNHRFDQLRRSDILDVHVKALFGEIGEEATKKQAVRIFRQKVVGIAEAFLGARQALRDLWVNSLDALQFVLEAPDLDDAEGVAVRFSYIELIAFLTQNRHLAQALYARNVPDLKISGLTTRLSKDSKAWAVNESKRWWRKAIYNTTRESLVRVFKKDPHEVVSWLRMADDWFVTVSETDFKLNRPQTVSDLVPEAKRKYGLVRAAFGAGAVKAINVTGSWSRVTSSAAVGLGGGRLRKGVETLIKEYLVERAGNQKKKAKVRLRKALVRFSEKVLFIANNDKLLSQNQKGIDRYVLVLQAVGNSIQIQANELKAQETFHEELGFREAPEIWAQETAVKKCDSACAEICPAGPCGKGYRDWSTEIAQGVASDAQSGKRSQRQVLDDMIALLRYEHILAVKAQGNGSDAAIHLAQALAVAYEQRAGMAYIRPSGAYLRSSYPATSLQDDPGLGWNNMLTEHGLRTTPGIGEWLAQGSKDDQARAKITAEIDKQFWQNINSVRVAGAGITNYVIVKDDVGNWYVKSYASNPAPIIKSAKSLAMFGIGQGFDPDLMAKALKDKKTDGAGDKKKAEKPPPPDPALGPVFNRKREKYAKATDADFESARILLDKRDKSPMVENIENAWKNNSDAARFETDLGMALEIAFGEASQQVPSIFAALKGEPDAISQGQAGQILAALGEIKRFHATLSAEIKTLKLKKRADIKVKGAQDAKVELENDLAKLKVDHEKAKTNGAAAEDIEKIEKDIEAKNGEIATADDSVKKLEADAAHAEAAETAALSEAGRVVGITASRLIEKRLKAVADYEAAVLFISDANTRPKTNSGN